MNGHDEYEAQKKIITDLQTQIRRYELSAQNMRNIQHRLDTQIEKLQLIHSYTQQAFRALSPDVLSDVIAEGIADVFQLEVGAVLSLDIDENCFRLTGSFKIDKPGLVIPLPDNWIKEQGFGGRIEHKIRFESPVLKDSPLSILELIHAVYVPIIGNERTCTGIILGGISEEGAGIYDFQPNDLLSSFMVYSQQMNGIYNGLSAMARAREADSAKTVFLANLSHEMRTPLNAIIGMANISKKNDTDGKLSKELGSIEISSKHLLSLINDILEISKIEEGKLVLAEESFCLKEIADNLLESVKQTADDKKQNFTINIENLVSSRFIGDPMRLSQVLLNLLSNAIKFTPDSGKIDFCIEVLAADEEKTHIHFSVKDTGIGILPEFIPNLFSPFEQADSSISRRYGGTGLGLAISQRIVEQMGSKIHVESEVGIGTLFHFSVWFLCEKNIPAEEAEQKIEIPDFSGKTVLVVDDVEINREIIFHLLEQTGISIENAQNGKIALDMVEESAVGHYDLILMDVQMPFMDGYTSTKNIRALDRSDAKTIIILAMTANAFKEDIDHAIESGMNGHMSKPVEEKVLLKTMAEALMNS